MHLHRRLLLPLILSLVLALPARAEPVNGVAGEEVGGPLPSATDGAPVDIHLGIRPRVDALATALRYTREALDACCGGFLVNLGTAPGDALRAAHVYFDPGTSEAEARAAVTVSRGTAHPLGTLEEDAEPGLDARLARVLAVLCGIDRKARADEPPAEGSLHLGF
jgi:hypothetical protein